MVMRLDKMFNNYTIFLKIMMVLTAIILICMTILCILAINYMLPQNLANSLSLMDLSLIILFVADVTIIKDYYKEVK